MLLNGLCPYSYEYQKQLFLGKADNIIDLLNILIEVAIVSNLFHSIIAVKMCF